MTGTNNNDYKVDVSLNDGGTLDQILKRLQAIDKQIADTVVKTTEFTAQMNRMHSKSKVDGNEKFDRLKNEIDAAKKALQELNRERDLFAKSGVRTVDSAFGSSKQTSQLKAQMDTFKRLIREPYIDAGKEIQNQLNKLQKQQQLAYNNLKKQQAEIERMQTIRNLGTSPSPAQFLRGRSQAELIGLGSYAKTAASRSLALGDKDAAIVAQKAIEVIKTTLADQLAPAVKERLKIATGLIGNQASIKSFVEQNSKQEVKETIRALRKNASNLSMLEVNSPQARESARLAEQLTQLSKVTRLSTANINRITQDINSRGVSGYSGKSTNELATINTAIRSEFKKAVREGRGSDADKYQLAANRLGNLLDTINNPTRMARTDALRSTAMAGDFKDAFARLTSGKSQSGLEQLLGDAKSLYRSDKDKFGEAEELRKLVTALKELVSSTNNVNRETKLVRQKTPSQELAAIEAARVNQLASQRYSGTLFPANMQRLNIGQLDMLSGESKLAMKAQELRVARAKETNTEVQAEVQALNVLRQQTRELEDQLRIKKQLESQERRRNSPDVIQAQARAAAEAQAARNSPDAIRQSILRDINRNEEKRRIDNGADMFQNQAMLLRNYAIMGAGVGAAGSSANFVVDLDKGFAQLQSILALTNNDMEDMKTNLIEISELTKFDTVQVVDAGVMLGQAGLSKDQITASLEGITLFATAVGTDLASAVDLATSAVGVFNIQASRMPEVVDKLTIAINKSKLNMDKLSLGLQYAGNIAEQSNVSFDETVSALAAMANSGIKSGSTLGTGLRQILITLQKPSEAFIKKIQDLGLKMSDLDLNTHSLVDIMGKLSGAGFTVVDAMQTMEVRTASAFSAFSNNLDVAKSIKSEMEGSGAAAQANAIQMEALANQWERFSSIAKSIVYNALEPLVKTMTELLKVGGDFLSTYKSIADVLETIVLGLTTIQGLRIAKGAVGLLARVSSGRNAAAENVREAVQAGGRAVTGAMSTADKAAIAATIAPWILRFLGGPAVALTGLGATVAMIAATNMSKEAKLNDKLDKARFVSNEIESRQETTRSGISTVDTLTNEAFYRRSSLEKLDSTAMTEFVKKMNSELKHLGFYMDETRPSFEKVISKLQDLRTTLTELSSVDINRAALAAKDEKDILVERLAQQDRTSVFTKNLKAGTANYLAEYNDDARDYRLSSNILKKTSPELTMLLDRSNPHGIASYTQGMSGLTKDSSPETISALKVQNERVLSQVQTYLLNNQRSELVGLNGVTESQVDILLQSLKDLTEELNKDQDELGNLAAKFDQIGNAKTQRGVNEAANQLRADYELKVQTLLMDLGNRKTAIRENREASPLSQYEQLKALNAEALKAFQAQTTDIRGSGKVLAQEKGLPQNSLGDVLNKTGLPGAMNQLIAEISSDMREVSKAALKDLRKRTNSELSALNAKQENLTIARSEATNPENISQLGKELENVIKRKNQIEQELRAMEAMVSENPDQLADVTMSMESKLAEDLDTNGILTQQQLAKYQAMKNFQQGNFAQPVAGERNNSELAKTARQYFGLFNSEIEKSVIDARTKAEALRETVDQKRQDSENASRRASDQGLPIELQQVEIAQAVDALQAVFVSIKEAIDVEREALIQAIKKDSNQLNQLKQASSGLTDGNPLKAAFNAQIAELEKNIAQSEKQLADLHRDEVAAGRQNIEAAKALKGELELRYNAERPYLRESKRRTQAMIYGSEYRTDEQIRNGEAGQRLTAPADGIGSQMANVWKYSTTEANKAYEGFDALTEAAEGLTETIATLGDTAGNFFSEFVRGNMNASEAVRGFAASVVESLADMAAKIAMNQIMMMIMQSFMGGSPNFAGAANASGGGGSFWNGGEIRRYATGGLIVGGAGSVKTRDSTLVNAAPGEFILRSRAVKALGLDTVEYLNQQDESTLRSLQPKTTREEKASDNGGVVNIWIVSEDEKPQSMDEQSTLVIIDKALRRKSSTRQLVKQIAMGDL